MKYTGKVKQGDMIVFTRNCYSSSKGRELLIIKGRVYRVLGVSNSAVTVFDLIGKKDYTVRNKGERMIVLDSEVAEILYGQR